MMVERVPSACQARPIIGADWDWACGVIWSLTYG